MNLPEEEAFVWKVSHPDLYDLTCFVPPTHELLINSGISTRLEDCEVTPITDLDLIKAAVLRIVLERDVAQENERKLGALRVQALSERDKYRTQLDIVTAAYQDIQGYAGLAATIHEAAKQLDRHFPQDCPTVRDQRGEIVLAAAISALLSEITCLKGSQDGNLGPANPSGDGG